MSLTLPRPAAGLALAAALVVWSRPLAGLLASGYTAATLGALIISLSVGLFGFHESITASFVTESSIIKAITVAALLAWTVLAAGPPGRIAPARWWRHPAGRAA